ncbi:hypothetical protein [Microvirga roseola]|uniref:hypothetical protein n=1 Tax=Microvirga roseola TaxID=2883126 RepID=UPI001E3A0EF0|nr:hypothetical protein [Microvirga roseola]
MALKNVPEKHGFPFCPFGVPLLKESYRMPHQSVNVLLTKLTWLHFRLKRKVKGELTRRAPNGSRMVNKNFAAAGEKRNTFL